MAKALKIVGTVVAVVGIVASAGALLAPAMAATATAAATAGGFLGMTAATLATIGTVAGLLAAGIGVAGALLAKGAGFSSQGNPLQFQTNPQSGLPYPMGRTRMSGVRIHAETYDAPSFKSESKQDVLAFAVLLGAGGPMEEVQTFKADKEAVTFDGSTGAASGSFSGYMAQKVSLGLAGASALALSFGGFGFPDWTADHKLSGIAHALWDLRFDPKGEKFGAGVPEPEWIGKWVKVYDPRKDSTYPGGSGAHRALNESTYEWSANPALHALTWALGRWQNGKKTLGIGAPVDNIRVADFVEAANVADANDWTCGGVEWSTDSKWTILKRILQAGGAEPTMTGAMIGCRVNTPRVSIATVTQDHLLDNLTIPTTRSRRDRFNTVIPRYRSEEHGWEVISGSAVTVPDYVTADGGSRTKEIDFGLVQKETGGTGDAQAGQLAAYEIVNSREAGPIRFTTGPAFVGVKTGDCITLDAPDHGLDEQPVIIRSRSIDPASFKITFEAETETSAKHAFALGKSTTPPPTYSPTPPDLTPPTPDAALWTLTVPTASLPSIRISGACEFPGADLVLIEYRKVGDPAWTTAAPADASEPVDRLIATVDWEVDYQARVAYRSGNRTGDWLVLGDVTTEALDLDSTLTTVLIPQAQITSPRTTGDVARALLIGRDDGVTAGISVARHDWKYPDSPTVITRELGTITGLSFSTDYYVYFDDATLTDTTVTYVATTTLSTALNSADYPSRHYLGTVRTPPNGGDDTYAPGVGGAGGQTGLVVGNVYDNDFNILVPDAPTGLSSLTITTLESGNIHADGTFSFTRNADPNHKNNVDGHRIYVWAADTNAAHTLGTDTAEEIQDFFPLWKLGSTQSFRFLKDRAPNKYYTVGVSSLRYVNSAADPDRVVESAILQFGPYRPASTHTVGTGLIIGGQTSTNVGGGAAKANTGLTASGNVASTTKVGGDSGQVASDVATATTRGLIVINANNNIVGTTKVGGDSGQTATNVSDGTGRALTAITSGFKAATDVVETISLTAETVTHLYAGATSSTPVTLSSSYGTYVNVGSGSFTVQENGADVFITFLAGLRFGLTSGSGGNIQFTAQARILFDGVYSSVANVVQTVSADGRNTTVPILVTHLFEGISSGSRSFELQIKADDPSATGDYAETNGVRALQILELKR